MSDNPFAKLQELFPKEESKSTPTSATDKTGTNDTVTRQKKPSAKKSGAKKFAPTNKPTQANADAELFIHAVGTIDTQTRKKEKEPDDTLFLDAMQAVGIISSTSKKRAIPKNQQESQINSSDQTNASTQAQAQLEEQPVSEDDFFANAMAGVAPVAKKGRSITAPAKNTLPKHPSGKTPAQIMQEIIDGRVEFAFNYTNEYMEGFVQGLSPDTIQKLREGLLSPEGHIDLHGLNASQAYSELMRYIKHAYSRNLRTITVITGRGKNSPDGLPVIRPLLQHWLTHEPLKRVILAFCTARACDGGTGALYVLIRKFRKNHGKIHWELPYAGPEIEL